MVRLTDASRTAIEQTAPKDAEYVQRDLFDLTSKEELEALGAVFDRLLENLTRDKANSGAISKTSA